MTHSQAMDRARWSLVWGILGVSLIPLLPSLVALWLAAPQRDGGDARVGWILGWVGVVAPVAAVILGGLVGLLLAASGHPITWEDVSRMSGR